MTACRSRTASSPKCARCASARSAATPLTGAVESQATNLREVIEEMLRSRTSERQGRVIDYDEAGSMEQKKKEGYF